MRTTLKRGLGRATAPDAGGRVVLPPAALSPISLYRQPQAASRSRLRRVGQLATWLAIVLLMLVAGASGGAYLYLEEKVGDIQASTPEVIRAARQLSVPLPGQPAVGLVLGYDRRKGDPKGLPSRSDTLMLVRADPETDAISMLSFPRDLLVEIHCPGRELFTDRINAAYAHCGEQGSLDTVKALTGIPINYLVTVNFRGFREIVDKVGGVWMDVDRRYFNDRSGPTGYATINLQPGYQRLTGYRALDFVRFRHTDSDLYRIARQQLFVKAFKQQVKDHTSLFALPSLLEAITKNVQVAQGGGAKVSGDTIASYAFFAYGLPRGHVFQSRIEGLEGFAELSTGSENIVRAVQTFTHPDVESPEKASAVALGTRPKRDKLAPRETTVTVLNGNGVTGSATTAGYLLGQRGYLIQTPPNGLPANAPRFDYFRTKVYYDARKPAARQAAATVGALFGAAEVEPRTTDITALSGGATLTIVVGQTFHDSLASAPIDETPKRQKANVVRAPIAARDLLRTAQRDAPFPLLLPTVIDRSSWIDRERPIRVYDLDRKGGHKGVRLVYRTGANEYWGIQMTDWRDAPVLADRSFTRVIKGRRYDLYFSGPKLHMVVLHKEGATYWVVNTLLDRLSNETMLAIAKGLQPLRKAT